MLFKGKSGAARTAKLIMTIVWATLAFIGVSAAALAAVVLVSTGLLSVFTAAGCMTGVLRNVATDLAPPAMLFTGFCCLFLALALFCALYIFCPRAVRRYNLSLENIFNRSFGGADFPSPERSGDGG